MQKIMPRGWLTCRLLLSHPATSIVYISLTSSSAPLAYHTPFLPYHTPSLPSFPPSPSPSPNPAPRSKHTDTPPQESVLTIQSSKLHSSASGVVWEGESRAGTRRFESSLARSLAYRIYSLPPSSPLPTGGKTLLEPATWDRGGIPPPPPLSGRARAMAVRGCALSVGGWVDGKVGGWYCKVGGKVVRW